jgi:hypothetical protein
MPGMAAARGKRGALVTGAVVLLAMAVGTFIARFRIREAWYLWRLESQDEEIRCHAAEMLGNLRSVRAVPTLVRLLEEGEGPPRLFLPEDLAYRLKPGKVYLDPLSYALFQVGEEALPHLSKVGTHQVNVLKLIDAIESSGRLNLEGAPLRIKRLPPDAPRSE